MTNGELKGARLLNFHLLGVRTQLESNASSVSVGCGTGKHICRVNEAEEHTDELRQL